MNRVQLFIYKNESSSEYKSIDLYPDEAINLTFKVLDLKTLDKRSSMYSKTFTVPGTKENNKTFGELYNVSADYTFFDPRVTYKCEIRDDSYSVIIKGTLKLDAINKMMDSDESGNLVEYEVEVHDSRADLFSLISDKYLTDIELNNKFDHAFTMTNIATAWSNEYKDLYTYPKYYKNSTSKMSDWHPAVFVKYLFDRIVGDAGFTYEGDIFQTDMFEHLIIPWTSGKNNGSETDLLKNKLNVGLLNSMQLGYSANQTAPYNYMWNGLHWGTVANGWYLNGGTQTIGGLNRTNFKLPLSKQSPPPEYFDTNELWNDNPVLQPNPTGYNTQLVSGSYFQAKAAGSYHFSLSGIAQVNINTEVLAGQASVGPSALRLVVYRQREGVLSEVGSSTHYVTYSEMQSSLRYMVPTNYKNKLSWTDNSTGIDFVDVCFHGTLGIEADVDARLADKFWVYAEFENNALHSWYGIHCFAELFFDEPTVDLRISLNQGEIGDGGTVEMASFIPPNIKQSDLLNDLCKMFNLYIISDPEKEKNIIFKTSEEFYGNDYVDWTSKLDHNSTFRIEFLPDIIPGRMFFSYKSDSDSWNEQYTTDTKQIFGEYTEDLWYATTKTEEKVELMFSPTPVQSDKETNPFGGQDYKTMAIDSVEPKGNIRILQYKYPEKGTFTWEFEILSATNTYCYIDYLPYAGHLDSPINPTLDLNFGQAKYDFFTDYAENSTDNNLFNKYYSSYFNMISEGKLITAYFYLNDEDIHNLDLSKKVFVKDNYYYINSIVDYNATMPGITKVELIKINEGIKFNKKVSSKADSAIMSNADIVKIKAKIDARIASRNNDFSSNNIAVVGVDNSTNTGSDNITIEGTSNIIQNDATNVRLYNADYNNIPAEARNIVIINASGITAVTNYTTYINDIAIQGGAISATTFYGDGSHLAGISGVSGSFVVKTGDTMTGQLNVPSLSAGTISATTIYADVLSATTYYGDGSHLSGVSASGNFVHLSGDTMTGQLNTPTLSASTIIGGNLIYSAQSIVESLTDGTLTGTGKSFMSAYINPLSTTASYLEDLANWDINGIYIGPAFTDMKLGQKHYNIIYMFEAVQDNIPIRLTRG